MLAIFLASCFASTFEVPSKNLYVPSDMQGRVRLVRNQDHQFTAIADDQEFSLKGYNVRGLPEGVTNEELKHADVYFRLDQVNENGVLIANHRLRGGGFWSDAWKVIKDGIVIIVGGGIKF